MTIYAKVAKVSGLLTGKLKADKKHQQGYAYLSADLILQEAGQAMAENGIVIVPGVISESSEIIEYVDQYGKSKMRFDACVYFDMAVSDGGEITINTKWIGRGSDYTSPDKALYKAITSGHKYFIMKLLNIGVGNTDSEHDPIDDYPTGKPLKSVPKKQTVKDPAPVDQSDFDYTADTRAETAPDAQKVRDPRKAKVEAPESIFRVDDEIMLHGKNDERPGVVTAVNGEMVTVTVDGKSLTVKADKLSLVGVS